MAVPDVTRQWQLPPPVGDHWRFDFPFTVAGAEVPSMYVYLKSVFAAYGEGSIGDFIARDVELSVAADGLEPSYTITMRLLAGTPMTWASASRCACWSTPTGEHHIYKVETHIERLSGDVASWQRMNRKFLNGAAQAIPRVADPVAEDPPRVSGRGGRGILPALGSRWCSFMRLGLALRVLAFTRQSPLTRPVRP